MDSDHVEVIKSNKGHYKIIHKGFMYTKHKSFNNVTRWRCAARGSCRGSIMTSNDFTQPTPKMAHTHPADYKACEVAKARYLIPKVNNFVFKKEHFQCGALNGCLLLAKALAFFQDPMKVKPNWNMNITLDPKQFRIEKTTRGAPCLIFENYKFRYGNKMKDEIRWRCTNKTCKATIKTNEKGITEKRTVHDHEPFVDRRAKKKSAPKVEDRSLGKQPTYLIPAAGGHFVECRQSGDSFTQTNMDILPSVVRQEPNIGGVRYLRKDGSEVILVNEAPTHFMDILRGVLQQTPTSWISFRLTNGFIETLHPHLYMTQ